MPSKFISKDRAKFKLLRDSTNSLKSFISKTLLIWLMEKLKVNLKRLVNLFKLDQSSF